VSSEKITVIGTETGAEDEEIEPCAFEAVLYQKSARNRR
jgi:hypothetical protein